MQLRVWHFQAMIVTGPLKWRYIYIQKWDCFYIKNKLVAQ